MIYPGEHIAIFGLSGCGKSTLTRQVSTLYDRKIIFDRLGEWSGEAGEFVHDFNSFAHAYRRCYLLPHFRLIFRPRAGTHGDGLPETCDEIFRLIYTVEQDRQYQARMAGQADPQGLGLILEEAWLYAPNHNVQPWLMENLLTGRHQKISIITNSQRPASVSKILVSQARHVFIGQFFESNDRKYYAECLGDIPELANPPGKFEFIWKRVGGDTSRVRVSVKN
jgi:energy-coupling factor transporter ATP-binding protein EcfA2